MSHKCTIAGDDVILQWNNWSARELRTRSSKIAANVAELFRGLSNPKKAEYSAAALLWLLVPDSIYEKYATPERLWREISEDDIPQILQSIVGVIGDASPDVEKKSTLKKSPSPESNSE